MKSMRIYTLVAGLCLGSIGCYYNASVPLTQPVSAAAEQSLLGVWQTVLKGDTFFAAILRFDTSTYLVHVFPLVTRPDTVSVMDFNWSDHCCDLYYRAFSTAIADSRFMNLQKIGTEDRAYMFFRYVVVGNNLRVRGLKEDLKPSDTSSEGLRRFLQANLENPLIYDDWMDFTRVSPLFKPRRTSERSR